MAVLLDDAVADVRAAWQCNTTTADPKWALRQLYGLTSLLIENRDVIISSLSAETELSDIQLERDLALLVEDISSCMSYVKLKTPIQASHKTAFGHSLIHLRPKGVSLIVSESENLLCHALPALVSCIAARNTVVLATNKSPKTFSILQQKLPGYLDGFPIKLVSPISPSVHPEQFDHVLIIDKSPDSWSSVLASPHVDFLPSTQGLNLVVVDEGPLAHQDLVQEILKSSKEVQASPDPVTAIFVHQHHFEETCLELSRHGTQIKGSGARIPSVPECKALTSNVFTLDLSQIGSTAQRLKTILASTRESNAMLLIRATSFDQIIDACQSLDGVKTLSLLGTVSDRSKAYFQDWTHSEFIAFGSVRHIVPPSVSGSSALCQSIPWTSYPIAMFSQPRVVISGKQPDTIDTIAAIRKSYSTKIPALQAEHPGGRVDFFVQVEYTIKTVAGVVGILGLVGVWYAGKAVRRHF